MKEWIESRLRKCDRSKAFIHFHPHAELRMVARSADVDKIVEAIRRGKVLEKKSSHPDKIAFSHFFKEGYTYIVITKMFPNSIQVKTVWKKKGRI